jgi:hypothetical protein
MAARRLEDRIRELCARALNANEAEWGATIAELQSAIQEHAMRIANLTSAATLAGQPHLVRERRNE